MKETAIELPGKKSPIFWKTILVPVDLSELSSDAINIAACFAEQCGAKIVLLHVAQLSPGSVETGTPAYEVMVSANQSLDEIADEIPAGLVSQKLVCFGGEGISWKIIETACEVSSDLIVLATHGYGPFTRALLGSTTERVTRHAPCAVLVVRQKQNYQKAA